MDAHGILRIVLDKSIIQQNININEDLINNTKTIDEENGETFRRLLIPIALWAKRKFYKIEVWHIKSSFMDPSLRVLGSNT